MTSSAGHYTMAARRREQEMAGVSGGENSQFHFIVPLNVGGYHYTSTLPVLRKFEESMLAAMFSGRHLVVKDEEGRYFIERDGANFGHILNFLRDSQLPPSEKFKEVYKEALYYGIKPLADILRRHRSIFEEEEVAKFADQCPNAQDKAEEIASLLQKKFTDTLGTKSRVVLQFAQDLSWESVHRNAVTGKAIENYYIPYDFEQEKSHEDHKCPLPEIAMGEMSESDRGKTLNFFGSYFGKLGYKMEVTPGECGEEVWSQRITWPGDGAGLNSINIHCSKKIYTLDFS